MADDLELMSFETQQDFEDWLEEAHLTVPGVLVKFAKKGSGIKSITYAEAVESALCFGWIDGQSKRIDDDFYQQRYTPRRKRSMWSKINTEKALELLQSGRMRPAGLLQVELARKDGRWDAAYHGAATAEAPAEFTAEDKAALEKLDRTNRYAYIHRYNQAKRAETKAKILKQLREGHLFYK